MHTADQTTEAVTPRDMRVMDYLAKVRAFHARAVEPHLGKPRGCSEAQVRRLEERFGFPLPKAYRQYLLFMGADRDGVFRGCDWFVDDVVENTDLVPELLAQNHVSHRLPPHYLAFFSHQGYIAAWFALPKEREDPRVWYFSEGNEPRAVRTKRRFTKFLLDDMRGMSAGLAEDGGA